MAVPTLSSITPTTGLSGGRPLVQLAGSGFRLPSPPNPTAPRASAYPKPPPSVLVTFDGIAATRVQVVSETLLRCLAPKHSPARLRGPDGNPVSGTADVVVQNLDDDGAPIAGETATLPAAFTFVRPRLDRPGTWIRALEGLAEALRQDLLENVVVNPPIDYNDDPTAQQIKFSELPGLGIFSIAFVDSERMNEARPQRYAAGGVVEIRRAPLVRDMRADVVLVSNKIMELVNLMEAIEHAFRDGLRVVIDREYDDPGQGQITCACTFATPLSIGTRIGVSDVMTAEGTIVVHEILSSDMPGAPQAGLPETPPGEPHAATREITRRMEKFDAGGTKKT